MHLQQADGKDFACASCPTHVLAGFQQRGESTHQGLMSLPSSVCKQVEAKAMTLQLKTHIRCSCCQLLAAEISFVFSEDCSAELFMQACEEEEVEGEEQA